MAGHGSEMIEINGCAIEVLRGGTGAPMVFLHGAGGASAWAPYMAALAERFDLYVPSHPGFGRSDTPDWLDGMSDLAYFYHDFLEALELRDVHLAGNSLGGWLAAEVAVRSTARIKTLTLVSAGGLHVDGVVKGDVFLWSPETRVRNAFFDQGYMRTTSVPSAICSSFCSFSEAATTAWLISMVTRGAKGPRSPAVKEKKWIAEPTSRAATNVPLP